MLLEFTRGSSKTVIALTVCGVGLKITKIAHRPIIRMIGIIGLMVFHIFSLLLGDTVFVVGLFLSLQPHLIPVALNSPTTFYSLLPTVGYY